VNELKEFSQVKIVKLLHPSEHYDGYSWGSNQCPPRIGDIGTIVHILTTSAYPKSYVVENSRWLGDFEAEELEVVEFPVLKKEK
jgi:hypothetical protein